MSQLKDIIQFTNEYIQADRYKDYCPNGLQVQGASEVNRIISGVSACYELFEKAVALKSSMVLVHHGLLWGNKPQIICGSFKKRIQILLENDISLLAYHLPLDAHEEIGNNILIAKELDLIQPQPFGEFNGKTIGYYGELSEPEEFERFLERVKSLFNCDPIYYKNGKGNVKKIGIISGGAASHITDAIDMRCDVFLTGEVSEPMMHLSYEEGIHFIAAGHYNTEKFGVQALGKKIAGEFQIDHQFIDIPNPV